MHALLDYILTRGAFSRRALCTVVTPECFAEVVALVGKHGRWNGRERQYLLQYLNACLSPLPGHLGSTAR